MASETTNLQFDYAKYGFRNEENYVFKAPKGLNEQVVRELSGMKGEPEWMLKQRLKALAIFGQKPLPLTGMWANAELADLNHDEIHYFVRAGERPQTDWDAVPQEIKNTFEKLGIPEAERKFLAGVGAQYECLSGDARVYTTEGLVPIRDIQPGATVFSFDEASDRIIPAQVRATAHKGEREVFAVRVGTRTIKATANHPFLTLSYHKDEERERGRYTRSWKYLHELAPGDLVAVATETQGGQAQQQNVLVAALHTPTALDRFATRQLSAIAVLEAATEAVLDGPQFAGYVKIDSITPAGSEGVYDIEVDGPHNFVAEGLIVHNSEVVYHSLREEWSKLGVIFLDTDTALKEYPEFFKEYFGKLIPAADNKYAALNTAVWSGGSFVYVPKGVKVDIPLQAYFRINAESMGQFERTLIIIDEGAEAHYIEGCFRAGARVVTAMGEKPIEQIEVGDKVLTHRGRYRKVYHTMQRPYQGDIYTMRYWGDSSQALEVTAEHPLLVVKRQRMHERNTNLTLAWLPASEVREGDYLAIPLARPETEQVPVPSVTIPYRPQGQANALQREISFPQEPDFYRLLGYYFAEGHVSNEHYLTFSFHAQEVAYLEDTTELLTRYFGKAPLANQERQHGQTLVLCSTEAARAFAYEFGSTVYEKHVPAWLSNAPRQLLAEFVRGLWCGDGSYDATKNMFRFNSVSRDLTYAFRNALLRLGIAASVNYQVREAPRQPMYTVVVASPFNPQFGDLVGVAAPAGHLSGSPFCLDEHYLYVPIRSITKSEQATEVYNFSVEEDESYVAEGVVSHNCTAPIYSTNSLHSAVVEVVIKKGGKFRYTTIQNWANNIFNLVTKRAAAYEEASMEWVDGNIGSKLTMKYPSVYLMGRKARGEVLSVAYAGKGQHQDAGAKMVHLAPETTSRITNKSVSKDGGKTTYRGLAKVAAGAYGAKVNVNCDALILDERSASDTIPFIEIEEEHCTLAHEATVGRIGEEQLFYLMSRGLKEADAMSMIVLGFMEPFTRELPMEYAVELNRLIQMEMEGSVG